MDFLFAFTPQLFYYPKFSSDAELRCLEPEPLASGVLINIQGRPFLITAKHIFDNMNATIRDIAIFLPHGFISLDGIVAFHQCTTEHDILDIAVIELPVDRAQALEREYKFLPWQNMNINHTLNNEGNYFFCGFINYQTERKGKTYKITPFSFKTKLKEDIRIDNLGFDPTYNIPLRYNKRKQRRGTENYKSKGPKEMQGLSGCGIWNIHRNHATRHNIFSLVGIMIEGILERGVLFGTHIRLVAPLLKDNFGISLPE